MLRLHSPLGRTVVLAAIAATLLETWAVCAIAENTASVIRLVMLHGAAPEASREIVGLFQYCVLLGVTVAIPAHIVTWTLPELIGDNRPAASPLAVFYLGEFHGPAVNALAGFHVTEGFHGGMLPPRQGAAALG